MRDLICMGFAEGGACCEAGDVGLGCGAVAVGAEFGDAEYVGHEEVGDGEVVGGEPVSLAQDIFDMGEPVVHPLGQAVVVAIVLAGNF